MLRYITPILLLSSAFAADAPPTELFLRGHSVIPTPQRVTLHAGDVRIDSSWAIDAPPNMARRTLVDGLAEFQGLVLKAAPAGAGGRIVLSVRDGAVASGPAAETRAQAYHLAIAAGRIEITGNSAAGLFYGVQTVLQLIKRGPGSTLLVPRCEIDDWPQLALRFLHWDTKHHQDRPATVRQYIDWAAHFKVNMIGFELEDKFAYPSNPIIGAPGALTPAELQAIVDYGLERFIQVVPIVQAPAHMGYVLKHPQFAHLRADGNNYMSCLCLEDTYKLIFQMYDDLIAATKGVDYFYVSTDEVYYAGIEANCKQPYTPDSRSAHWADFAVRARNHLAQRGRRMLAWLEYPLLDKDLERIPSDVIDGVVGEDSFVAIEKRKGMRQLAYVSMQGAELLFPDHLPIESLPAGTVIGEFESVFTSGRLGATFDSFVNGRAMGMNPIGMFAAAWDDSGLHSETFWLGWSAAARWGWRLGAPGPEQHAAEFMQVYYGPGTTGMIEVYRSMQRQARSWQRTWDRVVSRARAPGYGNSEGKGIGTERHDFTLAPPPLPDAVSLAFQPGFSTRYKAWLGEAPSLRLENDQLVHALMENMVRTERNGYNLEVFLALARFVGHHWTLMTAVGTAERQMAVAAAEASKGKHEAAVGHLVAACNQVAGVQAESASAARYLQAVFEKSRYPKGQEVAGRKFVQVFDDTKDHFADRTADLGYMSAPEASIGLGRWLSELTEITRGYAARHNVPVRGLAAARLEE